MSTEDISNLETKNQEGFFYIIKTPDVGDNVYKIGKTTQVNPNKRLCAYPKFSMAKYTVAVNDADGFEDYVMRRFRTIFKRRLEYGLEYYEGDLIKMIDTVHKIWMKYGIADKIVLYKQLESLKPNGWQAFCNDWLSKQDTDNLNYTKAYEAYTNLIKNEFMSDEYATIDNFITYLKYCLK